MIVTDVQAQGIVRDFAKRGGSCVFTNGCFDRLHPGHVHALQQMANLGNMLVVAINSDESVRRLKGSGRPTVTVDHRLLMLDALACVDLCYVMPGDNPRRDLNNLRPDVLAKGGTTPVVVGREIVEAYAGRVVCVDELPGYSTTHISRLA